MAKNFNFLDDEGSKDMIRLHDDIIQMCRGMYSPVTNSYTRACISANVHKQGFEPKATDKYQSFYLVTRAEYTGENPLRHFFNNFDELALYDNITAAVDEFAQILVAIDYRKYSDDDTDEYDRGNTDAMNWYNSANHKSKSTARIYEIKFNRRLYEEFIRESKLEPWFDYIIREDDTRFYICNRLLTNAAHLSQYENVFYPIEDDDSYVISKSDWDTVLDVARAMYSQGAQSGMQYADFEVGFGIFLEILFAIDGSFITGVADVTVDRVNPDYGEDSNIMYISHISNDNSNTRMEEFNHKSFNITKEDGSSEIITVDENLFKAMKNFRKNKQ